jgi:hypothetical protein
MAQPKNRLPSPELPEGRITRRVQAARLMPLQGNLAKLGVQASHPHAGGAPNPSRRARQRAALHFSPFPALLPPGRLASVELLRRKGLRRGGGGGETGRDEAETKGEKYLYLKSGEWVMLVN